MASECRRHFADPLHLLLRTDYGRDSAHVCHICLSRLAGLAGYRCSACDMDFHEACAGYFKQSISFFAHPWHDLMLTRISAGPVAWSCDMCREQCPTRSFAYRCTHCDFVAHPLCTMLPQTLRSPLHPAHDLHLVPSWGKCSACAGNLPVWHYRCACPVALHIGCASGVPAAAGGGGGGGGCAGGDDARSIGSAGRRQASSAAADQSTGAAAKPSHGASTVISKFLIKTSFRLAVHAATAGLASPVLHVLDAAFN